MSMNRNELGLVFRDWLESKGLWEAYVREWKSQHIHIRLDEWLDKTSAGLWLRSAFPWNKSKVNWGKLDDEWIEVWLDREL